MPYIQITWVEGRNSDQKRAIAKEITDVVEKEGRAKRENIHLRSWTCRLRITRKRA